MSELDVAVAGELNLDLILEGLPADLPMERELLARGFTMTLGSSSGIFAHNLASLGLQVSFAGMSGADEFGRIAVEYLRGAGVDTCGIVEAGDGTPTGVTVLLPHSQGRHILTYAGTIERFTLEHVSVDAIAAARHFHLSSLFLQTGLQRGLPVLLRELRSRGLTISLDTNDDPSGTWEGMLHEVLPLIDILLPNAREACRMAGTSDPDRALQSLSATVPLIVVKCGRDGAVVQEGGTTTAIPAISVSARDTIGAGDSFNAGFLAAWLSGHDAFESARAGNIAGALSVTREGGIEAFRNAVEREAFLAEHHFPERRRATDVPSQRSAPAATSLPIRRLVELGSGDTPGDKRMNPLAEMLALSRDNRQERGLLYTPAEIARQPSVWPSTFAVVEQRVDEMRSFLEKRGLRGEPRSRPAITLIGAGTSDYVGQCLTSLFRDKWQCETEAIASTTLLTNFSEALIPQRSRLWISFSRSGSSPEGVAVLQRALLEQPEIAHVVISCDGKGTIPQMIEGKDNCLSIVLGEDTNDEGLAMTGAFTNMVVCGQALAHVWDMEPYGRILGAMCDAGQSFLDRAATMAASIASRGFRRGCFLGSGALAGLAAESALKLLELSAGCVKTMSETPLGLRHGPMAALDRDTLLVLFLSSDETRRRYECDLLHEIEEKGIVGMMVAVNSAGGSAPVDVPGLQVLTAVEAAPIPDQYRPVVDVLFGQCLGLFFSLHFGFPPDTPSPKGIISRIVPAFAIH